MKPEKNFNFLTFMIGENRDCMLCMICKRYNCKQQMCPAEESEVALDSEGYLCPYFCAPSTPISDDIAHEVLSYILESSDGISRDGITRDKMEIVLLIILKQLGYDKTVKIFEDQHFEVPF